MVSIQLLAKEYKKDNLDRFVKKIMEKYDVFLSNYKVITVKQKVYQVNPSEYKPLVSIETVEL